MGVSGSPLLLLLLVHSFMRNSIGDDYDIPLDSILNSSWGSYEDEEEESTDITTTDYVTSNNESYDSKLTSPTDPTTQYSTSNPPTTTVSTTPKPLIPICPCAWVERGGFWSDPTYFFSRRAVSFVANRCGCSDGDPLQCTRGWTEDQQTLTFKWIGMPDSREYRFQMKFCFNVMPYYRRYCTHREVAYTFLQSGTWLYLLNINCRCPYRVADIKTFIYGSPTSPSARYFRPKYINMQCTALTWCELKEPCYSEPRYPDGKLRRGNVRCTCPKHYFCPLYYIGGRRKPVKDFFGNSTTEYQLFCAKV